MGELKQLETDKRLEEVFNYIANNTETKQNIFLTGKNIFGITKIEDKDLINSLINKVR